MKTLMFMLLVLVMSMVFVPMNVYAGGWKPPVNSCKTKCKNKYGDPFNVNLQYKFDYPVMFNSDGSINYAKDQDGNLIPNPIGIKTIKVVGGIPVLVCGGIEIREGGVICYNSNKPVYDPLAYNVCVSNC